MTRLSTVGFESQRLTTSTLTSGENNTGGVAVTCVAVGTVGIETSTVRSGTASASMAQNAANYVQFASPPTTLDRAYYVRGYFRFTDATPSTAAVIATVNCNAIDVISVKLSTAGKLQLFDSNAAQVASDHSTTFVDNRWYEVEMFFIIPTTGNTGSASLAVDGLAGPLALGTLDLNNSIATGLIRLGNVSGGQAGATTYLDDCAINDNAGASTQVGVPGPGSILLAKPTADSSIGTGWEAPQTTGSDTTNIYDAVNNMPPGGVTHSDVDANNLKYIFNINTTVPSSYDATIESYTAAGMPSTGVVRACQGIARLGTNNLTGANTAHVQLVSNPAIASQGVTYEISTATAGTEPAGWSEVSTAVNGNNPVADADISTAPVVRIIKDTSSTNANMCDLIGVLFEWWLRLVCQTSVAVSAATLALKAPTEVDLQDSVAASDASLVLSAVFTATSDAVSDASLTLLTPLGFSLSSSDGVLAASLALKAKTEVTLSSSAGASFAQLALSDRALILLGTASATSTASLVLGVKIQVVPSTVVGTSSATLTLLAVEAVNVAMDPIYGNSDALLILATPRRRSVGVI